MGPRVTAGAAPLADNYVPKSQPPLGGLIGKCPRKRVVGGTQGRCGPYGFGISCRLSLSVTARQTVRFEEGGRMKRSTLAVTLRDTPHNVIDTDTFMCNEVGSWRNHFPAAVSD